MNQDATSAADVVFNIATPPGRGAVATIIIQGPGVFEIVNQQFQPACNQPITADQANKILYGNWIIDGQPGEDLVVCPQSASLVEVHCHGGDSATRVIAQTLESHGAAAIDSREMQARISGCRYMADLLLATSKAATRRTLRLLLAQPRLHLQWWTEIRAAFERQDGEAARRWIGDSLRWKAFGKHLAQPWTVVLCGAPNVGKSSMVNALLGFERSIVHDTAGTTRDVVSNQTAVEGWPVQLFDTAGIRGTDDEIEQQGIQRARQSMAEADLVVWMVDASLIDGGDDHQSIDLPKPRLVVANKCDLASGDFSGCDLPTSALTGDGVPRLAQLIAERLVPKLPQPDQAIPVSQYQIELFEQLLAFANSRDYRSALDFICREMPAATMA